MSPSQSTSQTLEMKLLFKTDTQRAIPELQRLRDSNKEVDRAAKEAAQSQERLGRATGGGISPTGSAYGVGAPMGQSRAGAHAASIIPVPPPLPNRTSSMPPPLPGARTSANGLPETEMAMGLKVAALVTAVSTVTQSLANFARRLDESSTRLDPAGNRLSQRGRVASSTIGALGDFPVGGGVFRAGGSLADFAYGESAEGALIERLTGGDPNYRRNAIEGQFQARRRLASVGPRADARHAIEEQVRRRLGLDIAADFASQFVEGERGRMGQTLAEMQNDPGLAMAMQGQRRAELGVGQSGMMVDSARIDYMRAHAQTRRARTGVRLASGLADQNDTVMAGIVPTAGRLDEAARANILTAEHRLLQAQKAEREALNRLEQAGLNNAQRMLELKKSQLDVVNAELAADQKKQGGIVQFGMMDPMQQQSLLRTLEKRRGGQQLSRDEWQQLMGVGAISDSVNREFVDSLSGNANLSRFLDLTGQTRAMTAAERQMKLEMKFNLELAPAEAAKAAKEIADTVVPKIIKLINEELKGKLSIQEKDKQMADAQQQ